jgi:hypothetical protein
LVTSLMTKVVSFVCGSGNGRTASCRSIFGSGFRTICGEDGMGFSPFDEKANPDKRPTQTGWEEHTANASDFPRM